MEISSRGRVIFRGIELASSYASRVRGLSGRKTLEGGLLMAFPFDSRHGIWMPNMKFPIDIVFIDSRKRVVEIRANAMPLSVNPKTWGIYKPKCKARYVLELPANSAAGRIKAGDLLDFDEV